MAAEPNDSPPPSPAAPSPRRWTPEQLLGIRTTGRSLLVSAAAGSGKTAMLSERCAYLVCDAPDPHRCDVDELLVVTFTDAAAAEMKERIGKALRARLAAAPGGSDDRLARQAELIDQAQVSTLHSFCSRLLREHFHLAGLDPGFAVMDGEEAKLSRLEVGRDMLRDRYELDHDESFQRLVDGYADGDDERLLRHVLHAHDLLGSLVDPADWLGRAEGRLAEAAAVPLADSELGRELLDGIGQGLDALRGRCAGAVELVKTLGPIPAYVADLEGLAQAIDYWDRVLKEDGIDALAEAMQSLELSRLPPVKADVPHKDVAKAAVDAVRNEIKDGAWRDLLRFTAAQWRDGLRAILPHARVFLGLVDQFDRRYRAAKQAARQIDFADLERYALRVLRDPARPGVCPSPTALACQRLYKHVLVDEYQDINELQDAILSLVSSESVWGNEGNAERETLNAERVEDDDPSSPSAFSVQRSAFPEFPPNLFCVGDVKQSIYRFRLAEPRRFLERERAFRADRPGQHGRVIDLRANFRSRAPLLDAINGVFGRLMTRDAAEIEYDESHRLTAGRAYPEPPGDGAFTGAPIELHVLPAKFGAGGDSENETDGGGDFELDRAEREAVLVARLIDEWTGRRDTPPRLVLDADGETYRPLRHRDVAILLRSMRHKADEYADMLRRAGVRVHAESGTGYFAAVEVRDMVALLSLLDNQRQDVPLAAVLRSPLARLPGPEDALARVRLAYPPGGRPVSFHEAVVRYAAGGGDELAARLRDFLATLSRWRAAAHRRPLAETIAAVYDETGYVTFVSGLPGGEQRAANLLHLHERARQFGTFQRQGLGRFMEFLDGLRAESDLGQPAVASEAEDVVRIMSVHRSKGLEFPVVVLPDLGKGINLSDGQGPILIDRRSGLGMAVVDEEKQARYPSLALSLVRERLRRQAMAEELRVLYVAMTRAKEHLVLVGTSGENSPERWRARWSDHRGPLPVDTVLGARSILDWVGPVAACAPGAGGEIIRTTAYGSAEVAAWPPPAREAGEPGERLDRLARLEPLDPPPAPHPAAEAVIDRLTFAYPFAALARQPAARPMAAADTNTGDVRSPAPAAASLALPRFLAEGGIVSPSDVGAATHSFLQHLDFSRPLDATDLDAQIAGLVDRRLLDAAQAAAIDRAAVAWFAGTAVGRLLRENAARLRRELPVYFAAPPAGGEGDPPPAPLDVVMVRGRLDVLVPGAGGAVLVDYKTDAVAAAAVPARAESYRPQVAQYRQAVEHMMGKPVAGVYVVFLTPRVVWEMRD